LFSPLLWLFFIFPGGLCLFVTWLLMEDEIKSFTIAKSCYSHEIKTVFIV
jgi:hypothetical protein